MNGIDTNLSKRRKLFYIVMFIAYSLYIYMFSRDFLFTLNTNINFLEGPVKSFIIIFLFLVMLILNLLTVYFLTYSLIGFRMPKKDYEVKEAKHKFLLLVFAHNEENVIASSLESMLNIDYPQELYKICVLADNCTDNTVKIIEEMNNQQIKVVSRRNDKLRGKQYAANWFVENYSKEMLNEGYDYVVFLDADNHVDVNYLKEMNSDFISNPDAVVIQGYLGVKNPDSNYISRGYASTYNVFNRFYQLGKRYVKVNSHIGGTGFAFNLKELSKMGWHTTSLTEDYEMMVKLTLDNKLVLWNHWAAIYDEKPTKMKTSLVQRLRWVRGHWQVSFANFIPILKSFGKIHILNYLDLFSTAVILGKSVIMLGGILVGLMLFIMTGSISSLLLPFSLMLFMIILLYLQSISVQINDFNKSLSHSCLYSLLLLKDYMIYNITFIPLHLLGLISFRKTVWVRTDHSINENSGTK